ncbi:MAG TPA: WbqC family protein [Pyrinomonadaceae bacterium]|nr:WbqC family protein [Pyrinomonadaceae bacterium]
MKVAIHQPQYFPWSPYVHKVMSADIFVYLDTVQFSKNGVQNRNQIKTASGPLWLTLPVKHEFGHRISETRIVDLRAIEKHWKTLLANYSRSPGFLRWHDELKALLQTETDPLADIAIASTEWMLEKLDVKTKRIKASELSGVEGSASTLVASICKSLGADEYLTGTGALSYLNPDDFACRIMVQHWQPFEYEQAHPRAGFVPDLSALDLLLNCPDTAANMISSAGSWKPLESEPQKSTKGTRQMCEK